MPSGLETEYLKTAGLAADTVVVYTSDQGFLLGEHGLYDKRFMYEPSIRMPLLVRYPGHIPAGSTSDAMVLNLDFAEAFLDFARVPIPADMQGQSFKSIAQGRAVPADWRHAMLYTFCERGFGIGPHEGVRTDRYKLIHFLYGDRGWERFDLREDPDELRNLYASPEHDGLAETLRKTLSDLKTSYGYK